MRLRGLNQTILNRRNLVMPALALALALGLSGGASALASEYNRASVDTKVHLANHTPAPCFSPSCAGQLAPYMSVVHDRATVTSSNLSNNPTGQMAFRFFTGTLECKDTDSTATTLESMAISASGGIGVAESTNVGPLADGNYSYKAMYFPDAAAKALGFRTTPAKCEQLRVTKVTVVTKIHLADHTAAPCFSEGCIGQTAPEGSVVHDQATVTSDAANRTPTGTIRFAFFGDLHCGGRATSIETVIVSGSGQVTVGESTDIGPMAAGGYSYKAIYSPDAAAQARGLGGAAANCEQLAILESEPTEEELPPEESTPTPQ